MRSGSGFVGRQSLCLALLIHKSAQQPQPWNFTCRYHDKHDARGAPLRGVPMVPAAANNCLHLKVATKQNQRQNDDGVEQHCGGLQKPRVAVMIVGLARSLVAPSTFLAMEDCMISSLGADTSTFINIDTSVMESSKSFADWRHNFKDRSSPATWNELTPALSALRPRFITLNEPEQIYLSDSVRQDQKEESTGHWITEDSHCGGKAWEGTQAYPRTRMLRIMDRYRRGMLLVEAAEREDRKKFDFIVVARPDLRVLSQLGPWCEELPTHRNSTFAFHGDWLFILPRHAASALTLGVMDYWNCTKPISAKDPEEWLAQSFARAGAPVENSLKHRKNVCLGIGHHNPHDKAIPACVEQNDYNSTRLAQQKT